MAIHLPVQPLLLLARRQRSPLQPFGSSSHVPHRLIITDGTIQSHFFHNLWLILKRINLLHHVNHSKFQLLVRCDQSNQLPYPTLVPSIVDQSIPLPRPFQLLAHRRMWPSHSITKSHFRLSAKYYPSNPPIQLLDVTPTITLTNSWFR